MVPKSKNELISTFFLHEHPIRIPILAGGYDEGQLWISLPAFGPDIIIVHSKDCCVLGSDSVDCFLVSNPANATECCVYGAFCPENLVQANGINCCFADVSLRTFSGRLAKGPVIVRFCLPTAMERFSIGQSPTYFAIIMLTIYEDRISVLCLLVD